MPSASIQDPEVQTGIQLPPGPAKLTSMTTSRGPVPTRPPPTHLGNIWVGRPAEMFVELGVFPQLAAQTAMGEGCRPQ